MPLVPYIPDPQRYDGVFVTQTGYGNLARYRGSAMQNGSGFPQILKSLFAKIAAFAKPILRNAVPHARKAFEAAQPHLQEAASGLIKEVGDKTSDAINRKLSNIQEGQGVKKKKRKTITKKNKHLQRIQPHHLPDFL